MALELLAETAGVRGGQEEGTATAGSSPVPRHPALKSAFSKPEPPQLVLYSRDKRSYHPSSLRVPQLKVQAWTKTAGLPPPSSTCELSRFLWIIRGPDQLLWASLRWQLRSSSCAAYPADRPPLSSRTHTSAGGSGLP